MGGRVIGVRGGGRGSAAAAVAMGVVIALAGCQQEMSRKDKGYSLPSFKGLPAPEAPQSQVGSSQNKSEVVGKPSS